MRKINSFNYVGNKIGQVKFFSKKAKNKSIYSRIIRNKQSVKECDSGDVAPCRQSRSHYQGLTERGALIDMYLLMRRVVY